VYQSILVFDYLENGGTSFHRNYQPTQRYISQLKPSNRNLIIAVFLIAWFRHEATELSYLHSELNTNTPCAHLSLVELKQAMLLLAFFSQLKDWALLQNSFFFSKF
jgi:hypothetical protein